MDENKKSPTKCGHVLHKGSSVLSFVSMLLIVALFLRMESINRKTEMNEMRISNVERRIEIVSPGATDHKDEMETFENSKEKTKTKVRRSLTSISNNKSLTIEDVRSEITKQINKVKPESLCQPMEKVCVPGPPGKKGSKGPRGRRGARGAKGRRGEQGIMGLPGRHGKQGIMGNQGMKGEKGERGAAGPRGLPGMKGDPGEEVSSPEVTVSPETQTVTENQTATFYCSARGNPKPTVSWSKVDGSLVAGRVTSNKNGGLEVMRSSFNDSGDYMCTAVSFLGRDEKISKLVVEVGPRLIKVPDRFLLIEEGSVATITCEALSYPPSVITWTRAFTALPKERSTVLNGTLSIRDFSVADSGTYSCTATNKLGSATAVTTLGFQRKLVADSCEEIVSKRPTRVTGRHELKISSTKFEVYCDIDDQKGWTLIARFSNNDNKTWMLDDGSWWYDQQVAMGAIDSPSVNADMISPAFWLVSGREFKITRSDDPSHNPLLQTTGDCLAGQTFRSKITSYGDFRNGTVWASDQCLGSCTVQYGGQYKSTDGFQQAECSGNIQSANKIGFWCDCGSGDGSVMMIGGGGSACSRADHGIGITEANAATFVYENSGSQTEYDFGYDAQTDKAPSQSYSLNLWIR